MIHQLVAGDEVIATQAWFEVGDRANFYQSGRNATDAQWRGAGNVLHVFVAERAFEVGFRELDFLRGDEQYKSEWADRSRTQVSYLVATGARARTMARAREARTRVVGSISSLLSVLGAPCGLSSSPAPGQRLVDAAAEGNEGSGHIRVGTISAYTRRSWSTQCSQVGSAGLFGLIAAATSMSVLASSVGGAFGGTAMASPSDASRSTRTYRQRRSSFPEPALP